MNKSIFFNNKNILITGASGLIGFNLCKKLAEIGRGNIFINYRKPLDKPFLKGLENRERVRHLVGDVTDALFLDSLPKFDIIFHLSGYGQPKKFLENPSATFSMNSLSTDILLNKKLNNGGCFIFMSSSEVYANGTWPSEESKILIDTNNIRNPYILGKLAGESIVNRAVSTGANAKSIRICLAYGPGFKRDDNRVINELIIKGCRESSITLMDAGSAIRKYIYIDDAVQAILNICENGSHSLYNLGGSGEISILNLAKEISTQTNSELSAPENKNAVVGSPNFAGVNTSRYEAEFGRIESINLCEGIKRSIQWYRNYDN